MRAQHKLYLEASDKMGSCSPPFDLLLQSQYAWQLLFPTDPLLRQSWSMQKIDYRVKTPC